ncbi:hypothetical protein H4S06_000721 [Coemansia sp. BCRC 34490]|nr:hypothetical protein H4S06_000721 [Coemansia sp. BCRC 34490]
MHRVLSSLLSLPIRRPQKPADLTLRACARSRPLTSEAADGGSDKKGPGKQRTPVLLSEEDIEEKHVRGWGNGGQKVNKTNSCVQLLHRPTGTVVICQDTRYLQQNRKIARKRLADKLDLLANGSESKIGVKITKLQARKHKQRQRSKKKYAAESAKDPGNGGESAGSE